LPSLIAIDKIRTMAYRIVFLMSFLIAHAIVYAQMEDEYGLRTTAQGRRIINRGDTLYSFYVQKPSQPVKTEINKLYYWFRKDTIMTTTGDYDGWLLDGPYRVYYPDRQLRESGNFHNGLREGEWKTWLPDGRLMRVVHWKKGEQTGQNQSN
jgi:hypothetical protein